jgi:sporulation protein YlmC with PRC-barrel domain
MKKLVAAVTMLSILGFLLTVGALAQTESGSGTTREPIITTPPAPPPSGQMGTRPSTTMMGSSEVYASKLIGASVKNAAGESVGKIDELVIDPKDARIKMAVVSVGGLLGLGAKSVAVPWDKVKIGADTDPDTVVVAMGKEEFEQAPGWQKSRPIQSAR